MAPSVFVRKLFSKYLWLNLFAMAVFIVLLAFGAKWAMDFYTNHGETIQVPDVRKHSLENTVRVLEDMGFEVQVTDTGFVKSLPPGTVLEQMPAPGVYVKPGRIIYLTINALSTPTIALPDIIDNCSLREATAKLISLGFKLGEPQEVPGEKDWVYGVIVDGKNVSTGFRVPIESKVIIQVGNGRRNAEDSVYVTNAPVYYEDELEPEPEEFTEHDFSESGETDDFEVVE